MPPPPSLCGSFLTNKRSLVAFTWSLTTVLTLIAFLLSIVWTAHVHGHYVRLERYYTQLLEYHEQQRAYDNDNDENEHGSSDDREMEWRLQMLSQMTTSRSMVFVAVWTLAMALGLSLYGSTTIVGFTSLHGVYIAPCFSPSKHQSLKIGMFGGAIVLFANVLLVCAIVLGEVRVEDWSYDRNNNNGENNDNNQNNNNNNNNNLDSEPYEIERIATVLAVTCMFLAPLYILFAVLLFFYYGHDAGLHDKDDPTAPSQHIDNYGYFLDNVPHTTSGNVNNFYALDDANGESGVALGRMGSHESALLRHVPQQPHVLGQHINTNARSSSLQQPPPPPSTYALGTTGM